MALLVAACGADAGNNGASPTNAAGNSGRDKGASDAQTKVRGLAENDRNGVLIRAIRDAGQECQRVDGSELMQTSNNVPVYMATCDGGRVYAVAIREDGQAIVRPAMREEGL